MHVRKRLTNDLVCSSSFAVTKFQSDTRGRILQLSFFISDPIQDRSWLLRITNRKS